MLWRWEQLRYHGSQQELKILTILERRSWVKETVSKNLTTQALETRFTEKEGSQLQTLPSHIISMIQTYQKWHIMKMNWVFGDIATQSLNHFSRIMHAMKPIQSWLKWRKTSKDFQPILFLNLIQFPNIFKQRLDGDLSQLEDF